MRKVTLLTGVLALQAFAAAPVAVKSPSLTSSLVELRFALDVANPSNSRVVTTDSVGGGLILLHLDGGVAQTSPLPVMKSVDARSLAAEWLLAGAAPTSALVTFHVSLDGGFDMNPTGSSSQALPTRVALLDVGGGLFRAFVETGSGTITEFALDSTARPISLLPAGVFTVPGPVLAMVADDSTRRVYVSLQNVGLGHLADGGFVSDVSRDAGVPTGLAFTNAVDAGLLFAAMGTTQPIEVFKVGAGGVSSAGSLAIAGTPRVMSVAVTRRGLPGFVDGALAFSDFTGVSGTVGLVQFAEVLKAVPGIPVPPPDGGADGGLVDGGATDGGSGFTPGVVKGGGSDPGDEEPRGCGCSSSSALSALFLGLWVLFLRRKESP